MGGVVIRTFRSEKQSPSCALERAVVRLRRLTATLILLMASYSLANECIYIWDLRDSVQCVISHALSFFRLHSSRASRFLSACVVGSLADWLSARYVERPSSNSLRASCFIYKELDSRFLSPHVTRRHVVYCRPMCLWVTPATKSTKFRSRYLGEGLSERDEIFQVARGGIDVLHHPDRWPLIQAKSQNIEGCKKFCNAFLQGSFTDLDEIWHNGRLYGVVAAWSMTLALES